MKRFACVSLLFSFILVEGCYTLRIESTIADPGTEYMERDVWAFAWGLFPSPKSVIVPNCGDPNAVNDLGLDEVVVKKNFGQTIITVLSLGIASPSTVKWKCNKPAQREED